MERERVRGEESCLMTAVVCRRELTCESVLGFALVFLTCKEESGNVVIYQLEEGLRSLCSITAIRSQSVATQMPNKNYHRPKAQINNFSATQFLITPLKH